MEVVLVQERVRIEEEGKVADEMDSRSMSEKEARDDEGYGKIKQK